MRTSLTKQTPTLPSLDAECYLLETDDDTAGPLQSLVLDHLLLNTGAAYWVDAAGRARTDTLARIAPSDRLLDRIQVARGFTAYQHAALVDRVLEVLDEDTALVVAPSIDAMYRDGDTRRPDTDAMLEQSVSRLTTRCREYEVPLLLTCYRPDELSAPVARYVDETIRCESTRFGPRFVGGEFETLVYPVGDGHVQTTLAFWIQVLEHRLTVESPTPPGVAIRGSN